MATAVRLSTREQRKKLPRPVGAKSRVEPLWIEHSRGISIGYRPGTEPGTAGRWDLHLKLGRRAEARERCRSADGHAPRQAYGCGRMGRLPLDAQDAPGCSGGGDLRTVHGASAWRSRGVRADASRIAGCNRRSALTAGAARRKSAVTRKPRCAGRATPPTVAGICCAPCSTMPSSPTRCRAMLHGTK